MLLYVAMMLLVHITAERLRIPPGDFVRGR